MITLTRINKIRQIIRYYETSKVSGADYGALALLPDGPDNRKQITYGASQTTEYGNLRLLLQMYIKAEGRYAKDFIPFINMIGNRDRQSLCGVPMFLQLLKDAAKDQIMKDTQDRFFMIYYFNPARQWFEKNGFKLPLSLLVIYDSFVHSGSIMPMLRNKFAEKVPAAGGEEKVWISCYTKERDRWLENHSRPILRATDYRTDSFINAINKDNWMLNDAFEVVNFKDNDESGTPRVIARIP